MTRRTTVHIDKPLHDALREKAAATGTTVSEIVNRAVCALLREDMDDLAAFDERLAQPIISYRALLADLKAHGKI